MYRVAWVGMFVLAGACSSSAPPPAAAPASEPVLGCAAMGQGALYAFKASSPALDDAQREYDVAAEDTDPASAAQHYLACARAYRAVPDDFAELDHVIANTRICYQAAIVEYYNGQLLERLGRAAVTAALADEPRVKAAVEAELASTKECTAE
ncbi:MAG: hypothetical protein IPL61_29230 [Myxococcales bacterium]|nr:hypothetical protein [Myxococcales bacterium]